MRRQWSAGFRLGWVAAVAALALGVTVAGAAPQRPTSQALQRLEAARLQLAAAYRDAPHGKAGVLYVDQALAAYNAARDAAFGPVFTTNSASGSFDGTIPELESNNTAGTAQSLDAALLQEGSAVVVGEIRAVGDIDFYSFSAPAGSRVWAYVDTGGTQLPGADSRDSILTLFNTDQTTVIETDDDDGSGNGRDGVLETAGSSVIAGRTLPGTGTFYLQVRDFNNDNVIAPYRLYVVLTTTAGTSESEANDTTATADTVLPVGSRIGIVNGAAAGADVDLYRVALQAGDVLTLQLDEDPGRDGSNSQAELALLDPAGAALLIISGFGNSGTYGGQAFSWRAVTSGIYFARVRQASPVAASDYSLLAAVHIRTVGAPTSVINGVLGSGSADYPAISGIEAGRLFRNNVASNCEGTPTALPGYFDPLHPYPFDADVFTNRRGQDACVAVNLTAYDAGQIHGSIYSAFDPGDLQPGYLGDSGNSARLNEPRPFSVKVAAGAVFVVVLSSGNPEGVGKPYTLAVTGDFRSSLVGCPANLTVRNDPNQPGAVVNFNPPGTTDASLGPVVCTPASGSFFPIGTTVVTCKDSIGTTCSFSVTVQDVQLPTIICPSPITAELTQPAGAVVNYSVSAGDFQGLQSLVCTPNSGSVFPLGLTIVTCTATDVAGNVATCTFPVTVRDTVAPAITAPAAVTAEQNQPAGALVNYAASATDNSGTVNFTASPASGTVFPLGATIVTCTATDTAGNKTVKTFIVTVRDTVAPVITCPSAVTVNQDRVAGALVNYAASATDNSGTVNFTASPASGTVFPVGPTIVTCTASDPAGNTTVKTFLVTVKDPEAPVITCPTAITVDQDQPNGALVTYAASATDNSGTVNFTALPASGTVFPLGPTVVTCTATDPSGNTTVRTFLVTVKDPEAPVITCPTAITINQDRPTGALVTYAASATDNSGTVNLTTSPSSGTVFPLGATIVTCTAADPSGNTTVRTFIVTVKDTQAPTLTCPASVSALQDLSGGAVVSYTVTTSDNGGSVNLTATPPSGSFFPVGTTTVNCTAVDTSGNVSTCSFAVTVTAPASTSGVKVAGSGTIATGSPAAKFKVSASVATTGGLKLTFTYTHAKAQRALKSTSVSAIVRSGNLVKIFGKLRNGLGPEQEFLLEVRDVAKPGAGQDTFRLDVKGGAQIAQTVIATGDLKITP